MEEILEEARHLASLGVKELNIVSQDTTYYGRDLYGKGYFPKLLTKLQNVEGIEWIRLLYLYPTEIDSELLRLIADSEKILPYFDIPLQHVSDRVLKSMRRGYGERFARELLEDIYRHIPDAVIRTTFIVGYPTEREEDFEKLKSFVEEGHIHWLGVFTYSHEEGTQAYSLEDSIPYDEKALRREEIMQTQLEITRRRNERYVGKRLRVLVDGTAQEFPVPVGRAYMHAPEVDGVIYIQSEKPLREGDTVEVYIERVVDYDLVGTCSDNLRLIGHKKFK
jgi:ribosomal protein S12 methylthiotransferase